ncbi:hypothetical protein PFICI_11532 [Pestalotiopsis fici W106-1]|uniref:Uncharacterized protein n=1 Tax=Pestalotiopsis fici (strain W106-1 / CGMCC3.15140) TaxID=1229662 RepID=W3WQI6_PESFW|nr:uncharacterized protein PFICI_11532 [Pestalotiopsis fici W106-1]ETS76145.1 hypothetical protein PFICI_11532 [Pestalotiopsis fici W106-1]
MSYWEATGPALEAYNQLIPRIYKTLEERQGPLPNSDFIWFGLYMVGPDMETAMPHIMFTGENKVARKRAMKIIKESRLLAEHPGMHVGQWAEPPHIGNQTLCGGTTSTKAFNGRNLDESRRYWVQLEQFLTGSRRSTSLKIHFDHGTVSATSGLGWELDDVQYWLTAAHIFRDPRLWENLHHNESDTSSSEFEFDGFRDYDVHMNYDATPATEGHPTILSTDEEGTVHPLSPSSDVIHRGSKSHTAESQGTKHLKAQTSGASTRTMLTSIHISLKDCLFTSTALDYALFKSPYGSYHKPYRGMELLTSALIVEPTEQGSIAQVHSSHGILSGTIKKSATHVLLPGSTRYQEVFVAYLDSGVRAGDSGAVVANETGQVYGHIVSGSSTSVAFVVPLSHVYNDIIQQSHNKSHAGWSQYMKSLEGLPNLGRDKYPTSWAQIMLDKRWIAYLGTLKGHKGLVRSMAMSANGQFMASSSADATVRIWNIQTGAQQQEIANRMGRFPSLAISATGQFVAFTTDDHFVQTLDVKTGAIQSVIGVGSAEGPVSSVAMSANGQFVAINQYVELRTITTDNQWVGTVSIWNIFTGTKEYDLQWRCSKAYAYIPMAISSNGQFVALASSPDGVVRVWDAKLGQGEYLLKGHRGWINSLVISPNGVSVISAGNDRTVRIWDVKTGAEQRRLVGHRSPIKLLAVSTNGQYVISSSEDGMVRIWDFRTGQKKQTVQDLRGRIQAVAVSRTGRFLISASEANLLFVWQWTPIERASEASRV